MPIKSISQRFIIGFNRKRHLTLSSASSSNHNRHLQIPSHANTIKLRNHFLASTNVKEAFKVPISISDIHLRKEQLPFAYFFDVSLDPQELQDSFSRVLRYFPTAGGKLVDFQHILCSPGDVVPISFADATLTMQEWLSFTRGHLHQSGSGHHPSLLPIFDPLFESKMVGAHGLQTKHEHEHGLFNNLLTARVTHFANDTGTVVTLTANHILGDTARRVSYRFHHEVDVPFLQLLYFFLLHNIVILLQF